MTTAVAARALLNRRHQMELVVTVLASVHQEFPASLEALDLPDQQDHPVIMDLKDPWAQEETGEIKALKEVKVLRDLKDHQDQLVQLETRVTRGLMEAKVPQAPRDLKDPQVRWVHPETKVMQVLEEAKASQVPRELQGLWDATGNNAFLRTWRMEGTVDWSRNVYSRKHQTTQGCVSSGMGFFVLPTATIAAGDGISPSMVQSAQLRQPLMVWST